jgi:hypothetical protein
MIFGVSLLIILPVLWWIRQTDTLDLEALKQQATQRGWTLQAEETGGRTRVRLGPPDGRWTLELIRRVSSPSSSLTTWISREPALPGLLAVRAGPPLPVAMLNMGPGISQTLLQRAMVEMCGGEPGGNAELFMLSAGERVFDATHTVIVSDPDFVPQWITPAIRKRLQDWPGGLTVPDLVLWQHGLRLNLTGKIPKLAETLDALAHLGEQLRTELRPVETDPSGEDVK